VPTHIEWDGEKHPPPASLGRAIEFGW
jgi:hypothetical protein